MTSAAVPVEPSPAPVEFDQHWQTVRDNGELQFTPIDLPEAPQQPDWLARFFTWLGDALEPLAQALGMSWPVLKWTLWGLLGLLLLYALWRMLAPVARLRWNRAANATEEEEELQWLPDRKQAVALLKDADRLAAEGRFEEATHLLLQRSVAHISNVRPEWLDPSSTAREIASLPSLPARARDAFGLIAERVERSLFALRKLDQGDWEAARAAYTDFALADLRTTG